MSTSEAASALGISPDAVRKRASRGLLDSEKDEGGRLYIWLDDDTPPTGHDTPGAGQDGRDVLIEVLREQLREEREANRENRRIIAGLVQRVPELEPARESPESPETASAEPYSTHAPPEQQEPSQRRERSWWRGFFGLE